MSEPTTAAEQSWKILAERANERADRLTAELTDATNIAEERKRLWKQAEAQRDEAVVLLHLSKCIGQNPDSNADYYCWMHGGPKEEYCPRCTFLDSLSTTEHPSG